MMKNILSFCVALTVLGLSVRGADLPAEKTADEAWQAIQAAEQEPRPRDRAEYLERLAQLHSALLDFERRFPGDARRWDAKLVRVQLESALAQADNQPTDDAAILALTKEIVASPDASADTKADARYLAAEKRMEALESSGSVTNGPARAAADAAIKELRQLYPDDGRTVQIQFGMVQLLKASDPGAAESILRELAGSTDPQAAATARQQLEAMKTQQRLAKEPLDLKFQAVDGTAVDLAKLRGKVVLLDFWATWCGPCRVEIPDFVKLQSKYKDKGLEIVGLSLDADGEKAVKPFVDKHDINYTMLLANDETAKSYGGILGIPTTFVIDRQGRIVQKFVGVMPAKTFEDTIQPLLES